jgi:lipoprotein-releasing system ATP-binding protein
MVQLELQGLYKNYHNGERTLNIIEDLNYCFPSSGSVAIVGASGVGKSTLMHLLGGLDTPTAGQVLYDGQDIARMSADAAGDFRGRNIGFVFQFHHLLPEFSAVENVAMPLIISGVGENAARSRAVSVLESVGLKGRCDHRPGTLSGGEQQRVALARAIVVEPKVLLADEPTGNLDPTTAAQMQELMLSVNKRLGNLLIVVTHNHDLARTMDNILEMQPGGRLASLHKAS